MFDESKHYNLRVPFYKDLLKKAIKPPTFTIEVPPPKQRIIDDVEPEYQIEELDDDIEPPEDNDVEVIPQPEATSDSYQKEKTSVIQLMSPEPTPKPTQSQPGNTRIASPGSRLVRTLPEHPMEFPRRGLVRASPDQPVSPASTSREQSQIPDAPVPSTRHYDPPYAPEGRNL